MFEKISNEIYNFFKIFFILQACFAQGREKDGEGEA